METRSQARARVDQSPSLPVGLLEDPVPRPSSGTSESEEDLGLTTILGDGEALVVGRGRAMESATSGPGDVPVITGQGPDREPVIVSSHLQFTVVDSAPTQVVTSATTLLGQRAQIPTPIYILYPTVSKLLQIIGHIFAFDSGYTSYHTRSKVNL